jgi:Flp pilus assembly protein TadD
MPWSSDPIRLYGEAQLGLGANAAASAAFNRAIAKDPRDWSLWFDLARSTTGQAQVVALRQATSLDPKGPEIAELRRELAAQKVVTVSRP